MRRRLRKGKTPKWASEFRHVSAQTPLPNPVLRTRCLDGQTHPVSAFNPLNSTGLNSPWTNVLVPGRVGAIEYPQIRRQNSAGKVDARPGMPGVNDVSEVG